MKKIFSLLAVALLAVACNKPEPTPPVENSFKTMFKATPAEFSAQGGKGAVEGILQEISPDGKVISEKPMAKGDFTLALKSGDALQISIDNETKTFVVKQGETATFELEATTTADKAKDSKQTLTIVRGGKISYSFTATPDRFTAMGGKGTIAGACIITDASGKVVSEKPLSLNDFTLSLKGNAKGISVDDASKSFEVAPGNAATFELLASCQGSEAQELRIEREGSLTYSFKAEPSTFGAEGGEGHVTGICTVLDKEGKTIKSTPLAVSEFVLSFKSGNAAEFSIDPAKKSFVVKPGDAAADFVLEVKALYEGALSQELTVHRKAHEGPLPTMHLPLEYVTEYNINPEGTNFVTTQATNVSGYFTFDDGVAKFSDITIGGKRYHLPTKEEWLSIVPLYAENDYVNFETSVVYNDVSETSVVNGKTFTSTSDYRGNIDGVAYALRFKGTALLSAWRYEYIYKKGQCGMKITCRPIDNTTPITINDIKKTSFWESNTEKDITRFFPASGFKVGKSIYDNDSNGHYWASTPGEKSNAAWYMFLGASYSHVYGFNYRPNFCSVRLFISQL